MSDLPERKVLKNLLTKLKSRSIASGEEVKAYESQLLGYLDKFHKKLHEIIREDASVEPRTTAEIVSVLSAYSKHFAESVRRNSDDMKLYTETLEQYSIELDNTLTEIFDQARKQAEEQVKQQEELRKRTSPDLYTA